jgi:hypothetical protein
MSTSRRIESGALTDVSDEAIEARIPDRISSLRHLQVLYGALHSLATGVVGMTPERAGEHGLLGKDSIVAIYLDLRGEEPTLRTNDPVRVSPYTNDLTPLLAHSWYDASRGYDHSPTHHIGGSLSSSWVTGPIESWPVEGGVADIDTPLLEALRELGSDELTVETVAEGGADALENVTASGALVTFRVAVPEDSADRYERTDLFDPTRDWHWPGEFEAIGRAIRARREHKYASTNELDEAEGEGPGYVYGGAERLVGAPPDPLNDRGIWQTKTLEKFDGFDPNDSWRTASISDRAASMMGESARFVNACRYRYWRAKSPGEYLLWMVPYLSGELSAADACWLYELLVAQLNAIERYERQMEAARDDENDEISFGDVSPVTPLDRLWAHVHDDTGQVDEERAARLRVHVLGARIIDNGNPSVVLNEPAGSLPNAVALAGAHETVLEAVASADSPLVPLYGGAELLDAGQFRQHRLDYTATPTYFMTTCAEPDDADPDDFRYMAATRVLTGRPLDAEALLSEYADRIQDEFDASSEFPWPRETIATQIVQLQALRQAGLLTGDTGFQTDMTDTNADSNNDTETSSDDSTTATTNATDEMNTASNDDSDIDTAAATATDIEIDMGSWYRNDDPGDRERAIEAFIADRPPINPEYEGHDDRGRRLATERQTLVLMGALVSKVSAYQVSSEGRGKTLSQSTEARGITPRNIERIVEDIYHYNTVYSSQEGQPLFWRDLMGRLSDKYTKVGSARDWQLPVSEFVAWFACGVVFGSALPSNEYEDEGENENENEHGSESGSRGNAATENAETEPDTDAQGDRDRDQDDNRKQTQPADQHQETLQ